MKKLISVLLICVSLLYAIPDAHAYAQSGYDSIKSLESHTTSKILGFENRVVPNSKVYIKTKVDKRFKSIWFNVHLGEQQYDYLIEPKNGFLETTIILPYGPGKYKIEVLSACKANKYYAYKNMTVVNTDPAINFKNQTVTNSRLILNSEMASTVNAVLIAATKKTGETYSTYMPVSEGRLTGELVLPFGSGQYHLEVWQSKEAKPKDYEDGYFSFNVNNKDKVNNYNNMKVSDSCLAFKMPVEPNVKCAELRVNKGKETIYYTLPIKNDQCDNNIYFPLGPGKYKVELIKSTAPEDTCLGDVGVVEYTIINIDKKDNLGLLPSPQVESDHPEIIALARSITKTCTTEMEKTLAIHDWIAQNIAYDVDEYFNNQMAYYTALETLQRKKGICNAYSLLNAALHRAVGIRAVVVYGHVGELKPEQTWAEAANEDNQHAWNEVYIDGKWVIEDVTWDAGSTDYETQIFTFDLNHKYFNPTQELFVLDHYKTEVVRDL